MFHTKSRQILVVVDGLSGSEFLPDKYVIVIVDGVSRSDFLPDKYVKVTVDNMCPGLNSYLTNL